LAETDGIPVLQIAGLHKSFGANEVLSGISLTVRRGETVAVVGPSGSGKTTLLRCINFLVPYDRGEVRVDGELIGYREAPSGRKMQSDRELSRMRQRIGMVFQRFALFPHKTVIENLTEGQVQVLARTRGAAEELALRVLESVGLADKAGCYPAELSGGQQQRVGIARALCMEPILLLFDEATSALDPELVGEVLAVMRKLADEDRTMVVVTHELRFAREAADRIVFMEGGRIHADLPTEQFFTAPPSPRIAAFLEASLGK